MGTNGPVYLKDIWPTNKEIADLVNATVTREAFIKKYADVFKGDAKWQAVQVTDSETYDWPPESTYIQNPPYFQGMAKSAGTIKNITGARVLAVLGWMVYDHGRPLAAGERHLLLCEPVDPRSLLRGDYVILSYGFQRLTKDQQEALSKEWEQTHPEPAEDRLGHYARIPDDTRVYIPLNRPAHGVSSFGEPTLTKPATGAFLLARKGSGTWGRGELRAGIESYYVEEGTGLKWEKLRNQSRLLAEVAVLPDGRAGLVGLREATAEVGVAVPYRRLENHFYQGKNQGYLRADLVTNQEAFEKAFHPAPLNGRNAVPPDFTQDCLISVVDKETDRQTTIAIVSVERLGTELIVTFKVTRGEKQTFTTIPQESILVRKEGLRNITIREEGGANRMIPRRLTLPR